MISQQSREYRVGALSVPWISCFWEKKSTDRRIMMMKGRRDIRQNRAIIYLAETWRGSGLSKTKMDVRWRPTNRGDAKIRYRENLIHLSFIPTV